MLTVRNQGDSIAGMERVETPDEIITAAHDVIRESLDEFVKGLRDTVNTLQVRVVELERERDELQKEVNELREEESAEIAERDEVLESVKYWLHDLLYLQKPVSPASRILRQVEDAL